MGARLSGPRADMDEGPCLLHCRLVVGGEPRAARVLPVEVDCCRAVVAAPAACSVSAGGRWAQSSGEDAAQARSCCECLWPRGASCLVVFHALATGALEEVASPGACGFVTLEGEPCEPCPDSVMAAYCELGEERCSWVPAVPGGVGASGPYFEVTLSEDSALFFHDSVLLVPGLLSQAECRALAGAADAHLAAGGCWRPQEQAFLHPGSDDLLGAVAPDALKRVSVSHLGEEAREISEALLWERLLGLLEGSLPEVAAELFGRRSGLKELSRLFSPGEPAVNRYTEGGEFRRHRDRYSLTAYVLLSEPGAFVGGGTAFWAQEGDDDGQPAVVLRPLQGHAVVFNGDVLHAGWPVLSGVRHLFVASFHLEDPLAPRPPRAWRGGRSGDVELATE